MADITVDGGNGVRVDECVPFLYEMIECEQAAPAVLLRQPNRALEPGSTEP